MEKNKIVIFAITVWVIVALGYLNQNQRPQRCMDFWGHVEYTSIIANDMIFPSPSHGWETFQPPLYYLINSYIAPNTFKTDNTIHIRYVEYLSVFYGAVVLWIIYWFLGKFCIDPKIQLIVLLFIATTPKFAFVFSSYNNDSLAILLSIATLAFTYKLYYDWSVRYATLLLLVATAAHYTKYIALISTAAAFLICFKDLVLKKSLGQNQKKVLVILMASVILLVPWLKFHNYKYSGEYFPSNIKGIGDQDGLRLPKDKFLLDIVSPTAILEMREHKWEDPFHHVWSTEVSTKKSDYWSSSFINSIYGETSFKEPGLLVAWLLFWIHLFSRVSGLKIMLKSGVNKIAGILILVAHLGQIAIIFTAPYAPSMDYRLIGWTWLPWAILYANFLTQKTPWSELLKRVLIVAICVQSYTLFTIGEEFR